MATTNSLINLDSASIKEDLKSFLKSQTKFKDYDFEGSNFDVIMNLLAHNTFMNNFYANMMFAEMFMDSATLKRSVFSHSKELNYLPRSARSASATIRATLIGVPTGTPFVTIPAGTQFNGNLQGKMISFFNEQAITVVPQSGVYYAEFEIFEGKINRERYVVRPDEEDPEYLINSENVDLRSLYVNVYSSEASTQPTMFRMVNSLFDVDAQSEIFLVEPHHSGLYRVVFGRDVVGVEPKPGNVIELVYRNSSAAAGNFVNMFTVNGQVNGYSMIIETLSPSQGGSEPESVESIKQNAPYAYKIQDRAITPEDYKLLLMREFPEIQSVSVYGGELDPLPMYGRVIVVVDVQGADGASQILRDKYTEFLKNHCPLTVVPVIRSAKFMNITTEVKVFFNPRLSSQDENTIRELVRQAVLKYSEDKLNQFGALVRSSRLAALIDNIDPGIQSCILTLRPSVALPIDLNTDINETINFNQKLAQDHLLTAQSHVERYQPAVKSTSVTYNGSPCFIQDDGRGVLNLTSINPQGLFTTVKRDVGTVNYETGAVLVSGFQVQAIEGDGLRITVRTCDCDISAPLDRVVQIQEKDVTVSISAEGTR